MTDYMNRRAKRTHKGLEGMNRDKKRVRNAVICFVLAAVITVGGLVYVGFFYKPPPNEHKVVLAGEGYDIVRIGVGGGTGGSTSGTIKRGDPLHFMVIVQDAYRGTPVVRINSKTVKANKDGVYSAWNVRKNQTIGVSGLEIMPRLSKPELFLLGDYAVWWLDIANAQSYTVSITLKGAPASTHTVITNLFNLPDSPGEYEVMVRANAIAGEYRASEWSNTVPFTIGEYEP